MIIFFTFKVQKDLVKLAPLARNLWFVIIPHNGYNNVIDKSIKSLL